METFLLVLFPILLLLSALFSSSEIAFFSLSPLELSQLEEEHPARGRQVRRLLEHGDRLLNGILLGNLIVNIFATAVATVLLHDYGLTAGWGERTVYLVDVLGMTLLLLILGEITPKVYAIANAKQWAGRMTWFIGGWLVLSRPLIAVLVAVSSAVKRLVTRREENREDLEEELKLMVDMTAEQGGLEQAEKTLIHNIFKLNDTMVREIMVPRTEIYGISADQSLEEVVETIRETGHSRFPVYRGDLDNVLGVVYSKDVLGHIYGTRQVSAVTELMREVYYIPETKPVGETLRELQRQRVYMGIVVDEYGGTEGLVTVEDILEEILGEIQDEHDTEEPLLVRKGEGVYLVDGRMNIEDLSEALGVDLTDEGYETLGGFIFSRFDRLPHFGEYIDFKGYRFLITKLNRRRISQVRITRLPEDLARREELFEEDL